MTAVKVGALLPSREAVLYGAGAGSVVEQAVQAEALGFDSVWVGESLVARPRIEPLTALAAIAAVTERVQLGTAVMLPSMRQPVLTAQALATIDQLSGGRLVVGAGPGASVSHTEHDFAAAGASYEDRIARLWATVRLWRQLWQGSVERFESRFFSFEGIDLQPKPTQPGGPALWLAGEGPKTLERAGQLFDGWLPFSPNPEQFAAGLATVREAAERAGRSPDDVTPAAYLTVTVDSGDPAGAQQAQADYMEAYYGMPYDFMKAIQGCCAGDEESVVEWLRAYVDAGARHIVVRPAAREPATQLEPVAAAARRLKELLVG